MHSIITNNCQSDRKKLLCVSDMIKEEKVCFIIITAFEDTEKNCQSIYESILCFDSKWKDDIQ